MTYHHIDLKLCILVNLKQYDKNLMDSKYFIDLYVFHYALITNHMVNIPIYLILNHYIPLNNKIKYLLLYINSYMGSKRMHLHLRVY